jgi:hypothetical protein
MTGSPLRRLQELAAGLCRSLAHVCERRRRRIGRLPVRVQSTQLRSLERNWSVSSAVQPILINICSTLPNVSSMCRKKLIIVSG